MAAFEGDDLVGDLGVFWSGALCGFQAIGTHPDYRARGIAREMAVEAVRHTSRRMDHPNFVILTGLNGRSGSTKDAGSNPFPTTRA